MGGNKPKTMNGWTSSQKKIEEKQKKKTKREGKRMQRNQWWAQIKPTGRPGVMK